LKKKIKKADKISAWLEAIQLAGFSKSEASRLFGNVDPKIVENLTLRLRPPVEVRRDFNKTHAALLELL
jgi:hypothetical protein